MMKLKRWKEILKKIIFVALNIAASIVVGVISLWAVYSLDNEAIDQHVADSASVLLEEGTYPKISRYFTSQVDNWTDSYMLMEAAIDTGEPALVLAMKGYHGVIIDKTPSETIVEHYLLGRDYDEIVKYPRYWHGYLIFLKPLLIFMDYQSIRILNLILQFLLLLGTGIMFAKRGIKKNITSWVLLYLMLMPAAMGMCLAFSCCYYIFMIASLFLLMFKEQTIKRISFFVFLNSGIAVAFLDYLTYPIATYGIPMVVYLMLMKQDSIGEKIKEIIKCGAAWCIGYGTMWASKWFIASLITGDDVISDAVGTFMVRSSNFSMNGTEKYGDIGCVIINCKIFLKTPVTILVILFSCWMLYQYFRRGKWSVKTAFKTLMPYFLVSLVPVVWYAFATNHSVLHSWFTNKACAVTLLAFLFGLTELVGDYKVAKSGFNHTDAVSE